MAVSRNRHREYNNLGYVEATLGPAIGTSGAIPRQATHFEIYTTSPTGFNIELRNPQGVTIMRTGTSMQAGSQLIPIPREAVTYLFQNYSGSTNYVISVTWLEYIC